tara:strand:+ start:70 stop:696 length:627 start_codon:yes stop_codon:yes gene_type:complete
METWLPVRKFEGLYEVSSYGRIKSVRPANLSQRTLAKKQIAAIFRLSSEGLSARKIAPMFNISQPVVSKILRGAAYKEHTKILAPALRKDGYLFVTLAVSNTHWHKTLHSMVVGAFIGPRPSGAQVNHKDGNKQNNSLSNLEYVSAKENAQHALYVLGKAKKLTFDQAKDIYYAKQKGETRAAVAKRNGVSIHMVTAIWMGKSWRLAS